MAVAGRLTQLAPNINEDHLREAEVSRASDHRCFFQRCLMRCLMPGPSSKCMYARLQAQWVAFLQPDETAAALYSRRHLPPLVTGLGLLDRHAALKAGAVLEVGGPAGSGKSELTLLALAACLMPEEQGGVSYGGVCGGALVVDLDGKFDILRLLQVRVGRARPRVWAPSLSLLFYELRDCSTDYMLRTCSFSRTWGIPRCSRGRAVNPPVAFFAPPLQLLERKAMDSQTRHAALVRRGERPPATDAATPGRIAEACLSRLRLMRCPSSLPYLAALAVAPAALASFPPGVPARLLVLDNVAEHFYRDRAALTEASCGPASARRLSGALPLPRVHRSAAALLSRLARRHQLAVVATKTVMPPSGYGGGGTRDILPPAWTEIVTHRIALSAPDAASGGGGGWKGGGGREGHLFRATWERWPAGAADAVHAGGSSAPFMIGDGGPFAV